MEMLTPEPEREFRRRWYQAHVDSWRKAFERGDKDADWYDTIRIHAPEGRRIVDVLRQSGDLRLFGEMTNKWTSEMGEFRGYTGQMFINQLVKNDVDPEGLSRVLPEVLSPPRDDQQAVEKISELADFVAKIKSKASRLAPGAASFFLSFFWALGDHSHPVMWRSAREFIEVSTGESLPTDPPERYSRYVELVRELDTEFEHYVEMTGWWHRQKPLLVTGELLRILSDRCEFGGTWTDKEDRYQRIREFEANTQTLMSVVRYIGHSLQREMEKHLNRELKLGKPSKEWVEGNPRNDAMTEWVATIPYPPGLRLWLNRRGMTICIAPGIGPPDQYGGRGTEKRWYGKTAEVANRFATEGFEISNVGGGKYGRDRGFYGRMGSFVYGRWYSRDQLEEIDVRSECGTVVPQLRPILDEWLNLYHGSPDIDRRVKEFRSQGYPTAHDEQQGAVREKLARPLEADRIAQVDISDLRRVWTTGDYGSPGLQSRLNTAANDSHTFLRIVKAISHLCWGEGEPAARIDALLEDGAHSVSGLGQSVIMKFLAVCHPDRFIPVFPYEGDKGKKRMLELLGLPKSSNSLTPGAQQVLANDLLRERLEAFFPKDPWGMAKFLYWYSERDRPHDPIGELATKLLVDPSRLREVVGLLEDKRQVILYGPPGTGKTYLARKLAECLAPDEARRSFVQFHPSMSYEDFFEGYRPVETSGAMAYVLTPGPLRTIAERASGDDRQRYVMVIDEINRANLPKVLGELLFLLEYRNERVLPLYRPNEPFKLPPNLWFIGTMNTADRSIALVDAALRRRFHFVPFFPDHGIVKGLLERWLEDREESSWVGTMVAGVNKELTEALGGPHLQLGASHFMKPGIGDDKSGVLEMVWKYTIEPFIEEQLFDRPEEVRRLRFDEVRERYGAQVQPEGEQATEEE